MFVYYYVHVPHGFADVEPRLLAMVPGLPGWAEQGYRDGERLQARIGTRGGLVAKTVQLSIGAPVRGDVESAIPIEWEATGVPGLFPRMHGEIVVAALGPGLTQLSLRGTYRVPFGRVGAAIDRTLLHRLAEASVKSFVDRMAEAVMAACTTVEGGVR